MQSDTRIRIEVNLRNASTFLVPSIFMLALINGFFAEIFTVFGKSYPTAWGLAVVILMSFVAWLICLSQNPRTTLGILFLSAIILVVSQILTPRITDIFFDFGTGSLRDIGLSHFNQLFGLTLPPFLLCLCRIDVNALYRYLRRYSLITTVMFIILMILNFIGMAEKLNYMTVAYNALPGICVLFFDAFEYRKKAIHALWIIASICILLGGCRGALLTMAVTFMLWWMRSFKRITVPKLICLLAIILILIVVITNITSIAIWFDRILRTLGYSSRILNKFLGTAEDGAILEYSGRAAMSSTVIRNLDILGHGVYSDQVLLDGTYVHNFVLEILYQFGYLLGIPILGGILFFLRKTNIVARYSGNSFLLFGWVMFATTLCVKLMISSTYLTDRQLWFFLGITVLTLKQAEQNVLGEVRL